MKPFGMTAKKEAKKKQVPRFQRRRAAANVPVPQSRSESRSVGNDESTPAPKTKARALSAAHPAARAKPLGMTGGGEGEFPDS
jgi:hypothetical protein